MANGKITFGKQSGGVLSLTFPDGVSNTEVVLPESGTVVAVDTAVTDNAITRYDGTTGKLQNSGVTINDNGNLLIGTSTDNGVDKLQVNGTISYKTQSGRYVGYSLASVYITNTNSHTLTTYGSNRPLMLEIVNVNSGVTCIPIYPFGGSGVKYVWNILNPETGAFVNNIATQDISLTVTDKGYYPNTYTITLKGCTSDISIQATTLNAWFNAYLTTM